MSFITRYGSFWGVIPQTNGRVFWVAPSASYTIEGRAYIASDDNQGLSPEQALLTLGRAMNLVTASVNDVIVLLPGDHTLSAQEDIDVAGVTITGLPGGKGHPHRHRATLTTSAADETLLISAARVELAYLHLIAVTAQAAIEISGTGDFCYIHNCSFDMYTAAASTSTMGIQSIAASGGLSNLYVEDCYFETLGAQGPYLDLNDVVTAEIVNCRFRHRGSTVLDDGIVSATGAVDVVIRDCIMTAGTAGIITDAIDWTGNTIDFSLQLINVKLPAASGINGSADADILVDERTALLQIADGASLPINAINAS